MTDIWAQFKDADQPSEAARKPDMWDQFADAKPELSGQVAPDATSTGLVTPANAQSAATPQPKQTASPGMLDGIKSAVTGAGRAEFPDAPEFASRWQDAGKFTGPDDPEYKAFKSYASSALSVSPDGQLDILKKHVPGLEAQKDDKGNVMVRRPGEDWAYLNKPGMSGRDGEELAASAIATAPAMIATGGGALLARMGFGAAGMAGASVLQDKMAQEAGSQQPVDPVRAGVAGVIGGVLAPGVPSAIAGGVRDAAEYITAPAVNMVRGATNPTGQAERIVGNAMDRDIAQRSAPHTFEEAEVRRRMADQYDKGVSGDDLRVLDVGGETIRATARSAANLSPVARQTINDVISPRFETQSERAAEFLGGLSRTGLPASTTREQLEEAARRANGPAYAKANADGAAGVGGETLARLSQTPAMQQAMKDALPALANKAGVKNAPGRSPRVEAVGPNGNPTIEYWDQVQRQLRDTAEGLTRSGSKEAARDVNAIRRELLTALDTAVPSFKEARGQAASFFGAADALEAGEKFVSGRFENALAGAAIKKMSPEEKALFRDGFVSKLVASVRETKDRRTLLNTIAATPAARERIEMALGQNGARELEAFLRIEGLMDLSRTAVQGNSTTARQLMEMGIGAGVGGVVSGGDVQNPQGWIVGALAGLGARGVNVARSGIDQKVAEKVAKLLVSKDAAEFQRGVQAVAHSPMLKALREFDVPQPVRAIAGQRIAPSEDHGGQR